MPASNDANRRRRHVDIGQVLKNAPLCACTCIVHWYRPRRSSPKPSACDISAGQPQPIALFPWNVSFKMKRPVRVVRTGRCARSARGETDQTEPGSGGETGLFSATLLSRPQGRIHVVEYTRKRKIAVLDKSVVDT